MRTPEAYAGQKGLWGEQCSPGFSMDGDNLEGKMQVAMSMERIVGTFYSESCM